jgi:hydroxymethylbilane synthase
MDLPPGFALAAVLEREDPRDAFVSPTFDSLGALPQGARVGTSSLRRVVQLRAQRPDLQVEPLRGNLDTRLRKLDERQYDAIVLAAAGLNRLGLASRIRALFEPEQMLPCAGQGALGLETRADAGELLACLQTLTHTPTALAVEAERAVSRALGGSCSMPLAAFAQWHGDALQLRVALGHPERTDAALLRADVQGGATDAAQARELGARAAEALRAQGSASYLAA